MVWFLVDDKLHSNNKIRKVIADDPAALALWTVAGSWSSDNLEDGFVPDHQLPWLMPARAEELAQKLVSARLWRRVRGGYQFHEWDADGDGSRRNPTREEVIDKRAKRAEAGRKGGLNSGKTRSNGEANASANGSANAKQKRTHTKPLDTSKEVSSERSNCFDAEVWAIYPNKRGSKQKSFEAYEKALDAGASHEQIVAGVQAYQRQCAQEKTEPKFIAHATTWLNQQRWETQQEPEPERARSLWDN